MIPLHHCKGKKIVVVGTGKAGMAVLDALREGGATVIAWDDKPEVREALTEAGYAVAAPDAIDWKRVDELVLSPGVPLYRPTPHAAAAKARQANVPIIGEVELLYREFPTLRYVGITGTNGKSTATELTGHLLRAGGINVQVGGNLGIPAVGLEPPDPDTVFVLEMSSYQLDLVHQTRFESAVLLNLSIDHQERHGTMQGYTDAKRRIFANQKGQDLAVVGWDDGYSRTLLTEMVKSHTGRMAGIGKAEASVPGVMAIRYQGTQLEVVANDQRVMQFDLARAPSLQGPHNAQNACGAIALALSFGVAPEVIQQALESYKGLPHRMEEVVVHAGVRYVNDSKATNADAAEQALKSYGSIFWICGGKPKEGDVLNSDIIKASVRKAYLVGEAQERFAQALEGVVPFEKCGTLDVAFAAAARDAEAAVAFQPVVLLSPACASWDQWKSFEERGNRFRTLVQLHMMEKEAAHAGA